MKTSQGEAFKEKTCSNFQRFNDLSINQPHHFGPCDDGSCPYIATSELTLKSMDVGDKKRTTHVHNFYKAQQVLTFNFVV